MYLVIFIQGRDILVVTTYCWHPRRDKFYFVFSNFLSISLFKQNSADQGSIATIFKLLTLCFFFSLPTLVVFSRCNPLLLRFLVSIGPSLFRQFAHHRLDAQLCFNFNFQTRWVYVWNHPVSFRADFSFRVSHFVWPSCLLNVWWKNIHCSANSAFWHGKFLVRHWQTRTFAGSRRPW